MKSFKITAIVLTPGNYKKYSRSELVHAMENGTEYAPATYEPANWRPPVSWYKKMKFAIPNELFKKPGPVKGSAKKTEQFNMRVEPGFRNKLGWIRKNELSNEYGLSDSAILENLVTNYVDFMILCNNQQYDPNIAY